MKRRRAQIWPSVDFKCPLQESSKKSRYDLEAQVQREIGDCYKLFEATCTHGGLDYAPELRAGPKSGGAVSTEAPTTDIDLLSQPTGNGPVWRGKSPYILPYGGAGRPILGASLNEGMIMTLAIHP